MWRLRSPRRFAAASNTMYSSTSGVAPIPLTKSSTSSLEVKGRSSRIGSRSRRAGAPDRFPPPPPPAPPLGGRAGDFLDERGTGDAPAPGGVEGVLHGDVVVHDDGLDREVLRGGEVG